MDKGKKIIITIIVILLIGGAFAGGYYLNNQQTKCTNLDKDHNTETKAETDCLDYKPTDQEEKEEPKTQNIEELTTQIQKIYENAYNELYLQFGGQEKEVEIDNYGKKIKVSPIDTTKLKEYFTTEKLQYVLNHYSSVIQNDKYYFNYSEGTIDFFDPGTIFSATDSGIRNLEIKIASEEIILARSKITKGSYSTFGGEYIVFKKENGTWKIDMYE